MLFFARKQTTLSLQTSFLVDFLKASNSKLLPRRLPFHYFKNSQIFLSINLVREKKLVLSGCFETSLIVIIF